MNRDVLKLLPLRTSRLALFENASTIRTYGQVIIIFGNYCFFSFFFFFSILGFDLRPYANVENLI